MDFDFENTFNVEEYLYFYKDILAERITREIDFLKQYTELNRPLEILDLACGYGRHTNILAQMGHHVTGIDSSQSFLKVAQEEAHKLGVKVNYVSHDMRNIDYNESFDRIYVLFTSIGYFDDIQNEKVFRNIFNALRPGGVFCFDSYNRDSYITHFVPSSGLEIDGNSVMDQRSFDPSSGLSITKRTVVYNQSTKSFNYTVRLYNKTEIVNLFNKIGFSEVVFYDDWNGKPFQNESKRMIVVARK